MSRHYFDTQYQNRAVQVVLGYDRPLDDFFLIIMYETTAETDQHSIVYSSDDDPDAISVQGLDYYRVKLASFGLSVPESMFRETERDAFNRAGNRQVIHHADGRIEEIR